METINLSTSKRTEFIDITNKIKKIVENSKIKNGLCFVYCPHTTAAITINEHADPSVVSDIIKKLDALVPEEGGYNHSEGNSDAHIKSSLLGCEKTIIIRDGKLILGTWQGIFFCEFDGPRNREVIVEIIGK